VSRVTFVQSGRVILAAVLILALVSVAVTSSEPTQVTATGSDSSAPFQAQATQSDTVSGLVFNDFNADGRYDVIFLEYDLDWNETAGSSDLGSAIDHGVAGIEVRAYDSVGALVGSAVSGADGTYTLNVANPASTSLRVEFVIPAAMSHWVPSGASFPEAATMIGTETYQIAGPKVQFVELGDTDVNFAVMRPGDYCENHPTLLTCLQPVGDADGSNSPGAVLVRSASDIGADYVDNPSSATLSYWTLNYKARSDFLGSVFGIGVDREGSRTTDANGYFGTYVKRHSEYGNAGATNTIYRVPLVASGQGTVSAFVTLPGTLPAHDPTDVLPGIPYSGDVSISASVGRVGLGDVDVTDDGRTVLAVDMDETAPKLYFVPIEGSGDNVTAGTVSHVGVPRPVGINETWNGIDCPGIWHPMGLGTRGDRILVGGVCGAENTVTPSTPRGTTPTTSATAFVLEYVGSRDGSGTFTTLVGMSLGYERGCAILAYGCGPHSEASAGSQNSAYWTAWNEFPRWVNSGDGTWATNPQAMLANIEITDTGDLVLGFRDRFADQVHNGMAVWSEAYVNPAYSDHLPDGAYGTLIAAVVAAGDTVRICHTAGTYAVESEGTCANSPYPGSATATYEGATHLEYYWDGFPGVMQRFGQWPNFSTEITGAIDLHVETTNGSTASMPGYHGLWTTGFDAWSLNQQGVFAFGHCQDLNSWQHLWCYPTSSTTSSYTQLPERPDGYGSRIGSVAINAGGDGLSWPTSPPQNFAKGNGLADLETVCNQAPVQIGNRVWHDLNGDGIQDPGEPPIAGVTVRLYDSAGTLVGTALTDANGEYYFSSVLVEPADGRPILGFDFDANWNLVTVYGPVDAQGGGLDPGATFTVRFDNPVDYAPGGPLHGYELTVLNAGTTLVSQYGADELDNDALAEGTGIVFGLDLFPQISIPELESGENNHSFDLGMTLAPRVGIGDTVWMDTNSNGIFDADESPMAGVTVRLLYPDGTPVSNSANAAMVTVTDANGYFFFDDLAPWEYVVQFERPSGYWWTVTTGAQADSSASTATGLTAVTLVPDQVWDNTVADTDPNTVAEFVNTTIDAGFVRLVAVGDYVWFDADRNGVQDAGEAPLAGVVVQLFEVDGVTPVLRADGSLAVATTSASGEYVIDRLFADTYFAKFTPPADYVLTHQGEGTVTTDSNPDPATWMTPPFTLVAAAGGNMEVNTDTNIDALYIDRTIDAGFVKAVGFGDLVWIDTNADGIQDAGEPGLAGVVIHVLDSAGNPVLDRFGDPITATTDANGAYFVDGLLPGDYQVRFELPAGYRFTVTTSASPGDDSNPDPATGLTPVFTISDSVSGDTVASTNSSWSAAYVNLTIDAGVIPITGFGDRVWVDANGDGVQDAGEPGLAGVTVRLLDATGSAIVVNGVEVTTVTDERGNYFFADLVPGDYRAEFLTPSGYLPTTEVISPVVTVISGPVTTVDAGVMPLVGFGNYVWIDANSDGVQDIGEQPLAGVVVHVLDAFGQPVLDGNGDPITATTDANGFYFVDGLLPGDYQVEFVLPPDYVFTVTGSGSSATDSNPDPATGRTPVFTIAGWVSGDTTAHTDPNALALFVNLTIDAGVISTAAPAPSPPSSVAVNPPTDELGSGAALATVVVGFGNYVWVDTNRNGLQDAGEVPLAGVVVHVLDATGAPVLDPLGRAITAVTDANGFYFVDGLRPGVYRARFVLPADYVFTVAGGGNHRRDSNPDPLTGVTPPFTIADRVVGDTTGHDLARVQAVLADLTIDAGVVWVTSMQGRVHGSAAAMSGVVVVVLDEWGQPAIGPDGKMLMAIVDVTGNYTLHNLPIGRYRLAFAPHMDAALSGLFTFMSDVLEVSAGPSTGTMAAPEFDSRLVMGLYLPETGSDAGSAVNLAVLILGVGLAVWFSTIRRRRSVL
jgi:protocatechuate 3,4-dioxygenase beta subunit